MSSTNNQKLSSINRVYDGILSYAVSKYLARKELGAIIKATGLGKNKVIGEDVWTEQWKSLSKFVNKDYYRVFANYVGQNVDIVPDDICHNVIEQILNPQTFRGCIDDKNLFDILLSTNFSVPVTPVTVLRCVDGVCLDACYNPITEVNKSIESNVFSRLVAKPTFASSSGKSVYFFVRQNGGNFAEAKTKRLLTVDLLKELLGENFIVQQYLEQSSFMAQFCPTSVNTIRIATYRSVVTNEVHVLNSIMRIGHNGEYVDNAHAGGCFIGVFQDGRLGKYLCNQYGEKFSSFNGLDFQTSDFQIPNIERVWDFSRKVARSVPHLRLLQLDVAIDKEGNPRLIEFNIRAFSPWLYQFTTGPAFGRFTKEIIEYCVLHRKEATRINVSF